MTKHVPQPGVRMRQLKTFDQLRTLMIREAQEHDELRDLQPRLIALPARDTSGCNWGVEGWETSQGVERETCSKLRALVMTYRSQFNAVGRSPSNTAALLVPVPDRSQGIIGSGASGSAQPK